MNNKTKTTIAFALSALAVFFLGYGTGVVVSEKRVADAENRIKELVSPQKVRLGVFGTVQEKGDNFIIIDAQIPKEKAASTVRKVIVNDATRIIEVSQTEPVDGKVPEIVETEKTLADIVVGARIYVKSKNVDVLKNAEFAAREIQLIRLPK